MSPPTTDRRFAGCLASLALKHSRQRIVAFLESDGAKIWRNQALKMATVGCNLWVFASNA